VFVYPNHARPFRGGNGRATKVAEEQIAELSLFTRDYDRLDPDRLNDASKCVRL
jgi:fido (protein-threonine AMPylation protein)